MPDEFVTPCINKDYLFFTLPYLSLNEERTDFSGRKRNSNDRGLEIP